MFAVQMEKANTFQRLKPGVPKRILLFMAALVWSLAGVMLLTKGVLQLPEAGKAPWLKIAGGLAGGVAFYLLIFARISRRHARRIMDLDIEKPCIFSFFDFRSYLLMAVMITMGVLLRRSGWVPSSYLMPGYLVMGLPLLLSSFRFYLVGFTFRK